MGSPNFAVKILQALISNYHVCGVITQPDRPAGRGKILTPPPVKILAAEHNLPTIQPARLKEPEALAQLENWNPDVIVVAAFGQILRQNVLDLPKFGCINVHASYLPRWRGAAPIQAAILNGDEFSGVTIMKMDAGIDTGPILMQKKVPLAIDETMATLTDKLANQGSDLLLETLQLYLNGQLSPVAQPEEGATYAPMLKKEDGRLDFSQPAAAIERKVRAFNDWPGTYYEINLQPLKVRKVKVIAHHSSQVGLRSIIDKMPAISTPDGWVQLLEVQPAGKKWMSGADYIRGVQGWQNG